jgi:tripartite-type tricarboxylate transporter receptor subunit TctC
MFAVGGAKRSPDAPDVPTFRELGYPDDFILTVWFAYVAPAGTPKPIVDWLNKAIGEAMHDPAIAEKFRAMGTEPADTTPAQTAEFIDRERKLWERVAHDNNIQKE